MSQECIIKANPIRIIPFDLGRKLKSKDIADIKDELNGSGKPLDLSPRQSAMLKNCSLAFSLNEQTNFYIYKNGIIVVSVRDDIVEFTKENCEIFAVSYDENRKKAHSAFFSWRHKQSELIDSIVRKLKKIVISNSEKKQKLRVSSALDFENQGLSYVMTLSVFDVAKNFSIGSGFKNYPYWLQKNIMALLEPAVIYLEDSSKFSSADKMDFDIRKILSEIEIEEPPVDYERHKNIDTYMSWAAVVVIGNIVESDIEDYLTLEVQLQSDWFYVYGIEKSIPRGDKISQANVISCQKQSYELDVLENRLYDFDDSSMPARILNIQKGLVQSSGLSDNICHLQREIRFLLEREQLNSEIKQKRIGQSIEILLFIIAFIEVAPTISDYCNKLFPFAGIIANSLLLAAGVLLFLRRK